MRGAHHYDLVVIGSGPAGQKGAIAASKLGKKVAVIEKETLVGGVCLQTGTVPSKSLREAVLYLSGYRQKAFYGKAYSVKDHIVLGDLAFRTDSVIRRGTEVVRAQLKRNNITVLEGTAMFGDPHSLVIEGDRGTVAVTADHVLIACGSRPAHDPSIPFDGTQIVDSDQLRHLAEIPYDLIVVGGGVIGMEYASMFAAMDRKVTLINNRATVLDFVDREIVESLMYHMRRNGVTFRLSETLDSVRKIDNGQVEAQLTSGKVVRGDAMLYAVGRVANTDLLNLGAASLGTDERGRLKVNENFQTEHEHIYAAGDVIGFPSLASSSMEQGRLAVCSMFGQECNSAPNLIPYGIYTIPEISMVGRTEQELTEHGVPYEYGVAKYDELARGQMLGDEAGVLKLLFDPQTRKLLGVHALGENATEIIHIGQAVLSLGGTVDYFRDTVFNYPTLAEAYKVAALDGLNRLNPRPSRAKEELEDADDPRVGSLVS